MSTLMQHPRYALRQLRLGPVFTTSVILTLALVIGATTAIFTLVHAVMLHSLPVTDPSTLYRVGNGSESARREVPWSNYILCLILVILSVNANERGQH